VAVLITGAGADFQTGQVAFMPGGAGQRRNCAASDPRPSTRQQGENFANCCRGPAIAGSQFIEFSNQVAAEVRPVLSVPLPNQLNHSK